ncbi:MAG: efflux RND transporter permease subunit, partial [Spirochaetia bacterium]
MNGLIQSVLRRPIGVMCGTIIVSVFGIAGMSTSGVSLLPPVNTAAFSVRAEYPGLPAEEMQGLVTIPMERGLSSLQGLREMESTTLAGVSHLQLSFRWGAVPMESAGRLREAVDTLYPHLPEAVARPEVTRIDPGASPALRLAVFPLDLDHAEARRLASRELRARLQQLDGVGRVIVSGGLIDEVHVTLDPERLSGSGIDFTGIHRSIVEGNLEYAAGSVHEGDIELFVTTDARMSLAGELEQLYVARRENRESIRISQLASVESGHAPRRSVFIVDGREA